MNKVMSSSMFLVMEKILQRSIGLISTLILARILTPTDFGIIAKAMLVLWFVQTLSAAGTESYILQKETVSDDDLNTAWTLNFILKIISYLILFIIAFLYKIITSDFDLFFIIVCVGLSLVISAFDNPGLLKLKRSQEYRKIVTTFVLVKLITVTFVVPMALMLESYWAIVIGQIISSIMVAASSYAICDYRQKFCIINIKDQWDFSKWLIPQEIIGYFRVHVDTLIVGGRFESAVLGAYNNMKYFATIPMLQFIAPALAPLHAELGKVQRNKNEMKFQIKFTIFILGFIVSPIATLMFFGSEEIVLIILGDQWVAYHSIFGLLSLSMIPFLFVSQSNRLLMIRNKTKYIMIFEVLSAIFVCFALLTFDLNNIADFAFTKFLVEMVLAILYFQFSYQYCFGKGSLSSSLLIVYPSCIVGFLTYFFISYFEMPSAKFLYFLMLGSVVGGSSLLLAIIHIKFILTDRERNLLFKLLRVKSYFGQSKN
jgi:lipopolysaccharide exporter